MGKGIAGIDCRVTPFTVLAFVEELGAGVWCGVIGADRERLFDLNTVTITPRKTTVLPVKVCTIFVG